MSHCHKLGPCVHGQVKKFKNAWLPFHQLDTSIKQSISSFVTVPSIITKNYIVVKYQAMNYLM